jgi:hypothetical protein
LIFPYPCAAVHAEAIDAKRVSRAVLRGGPVIARTYLVVGKPLEGRRRVALPGGGCPGVKA